MKKFNSYFAKCFKTFSIASCIVFSCLQISCQSSWMHDVEDISYTLPYYSYIPNNNFSLSLHFALALGTNGLGIGSNVLGTYTGKYGSLSSALGSTYYFKSPATSKSILEKRIGFGGSIKAGKDGNLSYYLTRFYSGETSQTVGNVITAYKNFSINYENDFMGDGGDRYRTHSTTIRYKNYGFGLNMFTGDQGKSKYKRRINEEVGNYGTYLLGKNNDNPDKYRMGALYFFYDSFRIGVQSENIRDFFQNKMIHDNTKTPQFSKLNNDWKFYGGIYSFNPFTSW